MLSNSLETERSQGSSNLILAIGNIAVVYRLEKRQGNYYSVVSYCSCWTSLVNLGFVFVFACSLTSASGFIARTASAYIALGGGVGFFISINPRP